MGDSVANPAVALNYLAVPRTSVIGGLLFWPSRRSIVLLVMLAAAIFWLARRHVPWHAIADIPADRFTPSSPVTGQEPWFVSATELITVDSKSGATLIDLTTGRKIRRVYPATPRGGRLTYRRLGSGTFEHISPGQPTLEICDVRTGNPIAQRTNLGVIGSFSQEMSVDGKYAITRSITTTIFVPSTTPPVRTATNPVAERPGAGPSSRPTSFAPDIPQQKFVVWELDQSLSPYDLRPIGRILALTAFFTDAQTIAAYDFATLRFFRAKDL